MLSIEYLRELRDCLSNISKLDFSLYNGEGLLLLPPAAEDPIISAFASSRVGKKEFESFIKSGLERALLRKSFTIVQGPMNQHHCFIPAQIGDMSLILIGNAFYSSLKEIEEFFFSKGSKYELSIEDMKSLAKVMTFCDVSEFSGIYKNIQRLFNLFLRDSYEKNLNLERYRRIRTVIEFLSEIEEDMNEDAVYGLLSDTILFLFGGETVSVMTSTYNQFKPVLTAGALKKHVESIPLESRKIAVSEAVKKRKPLVFTEGAKLLRLGYPEDITSLYIFPMFVRGETFGILCIFNACFTEDDMDIIFTLCNLAGSVSRAISSHKMYSKHIDDITAVNLAAVNVGQASRSPDTLYKSIVEISSKLVDAERASLMLPEKTRTELLIKAAKGINKWIAKSMRVKVGEGIAGKVYKEGRPLMVFDIEKDLSTKKRPKYRTGSFVSIPLKLGDETIGVLNLADKISGEVFSKADMAFLRYFASYASIAIKGAHYYNMSEELRTLSITDSLTGLFNRRYFDERLFEELQRAARYNSIFSLAIFDIDDFKLFNDAEGHLAGDEVLKAIADIARESLRSIDIIARFGGEEFSIIMPLTGKDEAFMVAERVRKNIRDKMPVIWKIFPRDKITVSIGVAIFPEDGKDEKTLMKNADRALYRAKVSGKDKTVLWGNQMQ